MAAYRVEVERTAAKELAKLALPVQQRVYTLLRALGEQPRPPGCTKLVGTADGYRVRSGDYRVVYLVDDADQVVTITRVGHRREVYREK